MWEDRVTLRQNKYDDEHFFNQYKRLPRSLYGLDGAGEWHVLKRLMPDFNSKNVLDLGCGFGWHCRYARKQGAKKVIGVDLSTKMINEARKLTDDDHITYFQSAIEDYEAEDGYFDVIMSSLALHYVSDYSQAVRKIWRLLTKNGVFLFSVEHPIFTSVALQDWIYNHKGDKLHWPIDHYQEEGIRETQFLEQNVVKYHRTLSTYMNTLLSVGFKLEVIEEPQPSLEMLEFSEEMKHEMRRPMFLLVRVIK